MMSKYSYVKNRVVEGYNYSTVSPVGEVARRQRGAVGAPQSSLYKATPTAPVRSHAPVFAPALGPTPDKIAHCATCTDPGGVPKPHTKAFTRVTRVTKSPIHREHREHRETERARERPPSPHVTG